MASRLFSVACNTRASWGVYLCVPVSSATVRATGRWTFRVRPGFEERTRPPRSNSADSSRGIARLHVQWLRETPKTALVRLRPVPSYYATNCSWFMHVKLKPSIQLRQLGNFTLQYINRMVDVKWRREMCKKVHIFKNWFNSSNSKFWILHSLISRLKFAFSNAERNYLCTWSNSQI